jgi:hypothetical protein
MFCYSFYATRSQQHHSTPSLLLPPLRSFSQPADQPLLSGASCDLLPKRQIRYPSWLATENSSTNAFKSISWRLALICKPTAHNTHRGGSISATLATLSSDLRNGIEKGILQRKRQLDTLFNGLTSTDILRKTWLDPLLAICWFILFLYPLSHPSFISAW